MATINVTELATELDTDGRTARKFLRSITPKDEQPGKGSRWSIEKRDVRSMKSQFTKFQAAQAQAKLDRELAKKADEAPEVEGDEEPTAEDLAEIDAE
jgi:hypothetical protein